MEQSAYPKPGDVVGGKYRVQRLLGQGGMGMVFEAVHAVTEKRFAIKWLMTDPMRSDDAVARFIREAQVAGRCEHRNIVAVYDIDREGGSLFMVMELLVGTALSDRLTQSGRIDHRDACRLLWPCVEAVGEMHASGIIHRDLKPANLFICAARGREPELAKVLDFGVSRFTATAGLENVTDARTKNGAVIGTPYYMAPEQMRGQPADVRTDVYAMGVTLFEVLAGVRPYDAVTYGELLLKVAEGKPPSLAALAPDVPAGLVRVVQRAMASAEQRYQNMEELAKALEPFAFGDHASSRSGTQFARTTGERTQNADTPWVTEAHMSLTSPGTKSAKRSAWWWAIGLGVLLAAAAALASLGSKRGTAGDAEAHRPDSETTMHAATAAPPPTVTAELVPSEPQPPAAMPPGKGHERAQVPSGDIIEAEPVEPTRIAQPRRRAERTRRELTRPDNAATPVAPASPTSDEESDATNKRAKNRAPATMGRDDF